MTCQARVALLHGVPPIILCNTHYQSGHANSYFLDIQDRRQHERLMMSPSPVDARERVKAGTQLLRLFLQYYGT